MLEPLLFKRDAPHERRIGDGLLNQLSGRIVFPPLIRVLEKKKIGVGCKGVNIPTYAVSMRTKTGVAGRAPFRDSMCFKTPLSHSEDLVY
jgi:hypothetical protein